MSRVSSPKGNKKWENKKCDSLIPRKMGPKNGTGTSLGKNGTGTSLGKNGKNGTGTFLGKILKGVLS
jgi:hypothetical protein